MHDDYVSIDYAFQMSWKHNEPVGVAIAVFNYKNQCEKGQQLIILVCKWRSKKCLCSSRPHSADKPIN